MQARSSQSLLTNPLAASSSYRAQHMSFSKHARSDSVDSAGRPVQNIRTVRDVPTSVSSLLDACRRMEASLQMWSTNQVSESDVSDVFVTVGNEFHATMAAFAQLGIDTSEMNSFLTDLRGLLEECLSEEPTPQNVNYLMPQARKIIAALLAGLRNKQPMYWQTVRRSGGSGY